MNKSSNISKWVFGVLALVSVAIAVYFAIKGISECAPWKEWFEHGKDYEEPATPITDLLLNWSYIKVFLGILAILISAIVVAVVKGVNVKTILIVLGSIIVIGGLSYLMSKGSFDVPYPTDDPDVTYSGTVHGLIEWGINFFYITLAASIVIIIYSAIKSVIK